MRMESNSLKMLKKVDDTSKTDKIKNNKTNKPITKSNTKK